jgi:nucleoside 2-deoxyribosyltransferase
MKIVICGSMSAAKEMLGAQKELEAKGHKVAVPEDTAAIARGIPQPEATQKKIAQDLIRKHYEKIKQSDAVLVVNTEKKSIKGYIGGNSFLEMGFAFVLHKLIYLLNEMPDVSYRDEIEAMQPVVINGDLSRILLAK